ncbi:MAG: filamentous hemagglutinin N-terminal domain-containing protein, partial [Prochloraceae cyanobacterium]
MKFNLKNLIFLGLLFFSSEDSVLAQLVPDRTLGIESSTVVPVSSTKKNIEGGATRGTNIFHSFQEFNVNTGQKVFFNNPSGIKNIINRVTGKNISNISGTLGVNGNANLYLINPNGIIFGNGAKLDINGSFIGTTADGIKLGENDIFSATDPANSRLLTIEPGALFVNESRSVKSIITNEGNLEINPGAKIILSGDEITNNGLINSFGGDIFIEAVNGNINITQNINASALRDIQNNPVANGGDIYLKANKNITFNSGVQIRSSGILGGNINIQSNKNLRLIDGASARTITSSENTGGNLQVSAKKIELIGANSNTSSPSLLLVINSGNKASIKINTDELNLIDGGTISIDSPNRIDGGNIEILAKKIVIIGINKFSIL